MPLLEYQPQHLTGRSRQSLKRRVISSALIGVGGGVVNLVLLVLVVAAGGSVRRYWIVPFFLVSGPSTLALFVMDRLLDMKFHVQKEVIWTLLILASAAQYMVYGLLLHFRFSMRRLVLLLALLFHIGSGVFLCLSGFH